LANNTTIKKNVLANFLGKIWLALLSLIFVPIYISILGIEAYGIIGFYIVLQSLFQILDLGLGRSLNREISLNAKKPDNFQYIHNAVWTLEMVYWSISIFIVVLFLFISPLLANNWINSKVFSNDELGQIVLFIGVLIAARWPVSFYKSGLMGLQEQVLINSIDIVTSTMQGVVGVLIIWKISPSIQAFLLWQIVSSGLILIAYVIALKSKLPKSIQPGEFDYKIIKKLSRFLAGVSGTTILAILIMQIDKIVLGKMLPLDIFGYYMVAVMISSKLLLFVAPFSTACFPQFVEYVGNGNSDKLVALYHKSCQFVAVAILPIAFFISIYSYEVLLLWTGDVTLSERIGFTLPVLILGTAINGLLTIPYTIQLAFGWTRLGFMQNLLTIVFIVPLLIWLIDMYGMLGAASAWLFVNIAYLVVGMPIMHKKMLVGELSRWLFVDILKPVIIPVVVMTVGKIILPTELSGWLLIIYLFTILIIAAFSSLIGAEQVRIALIGTCAPLRNRLLGR